MLGLLVWAVGGLASGAVSWGAELPTITEFSLASPRTCGIGGNSLIAGPDGQIWFATNTDTRGATELVFALFDLLGLSFIRLRDAGDLRLPRLGAPTGLPVDATCATAPAPTGSATSTTTPCGPPHHSNAAGSAPGS